MRGGHGWTRKTVIELTKFDESQSNSTHAILYITSRSFILFIHCNILPKYNLLFDKIQGLVLQNWQIFKLDFKYVLSFSF